MHTYIVYCRWPQGDDEYFHTDDEQEALGWAHDASVEASCRASVYSIYHKPVLVPKTRRLPPIHTTNTCTYRRKYGNA